MKRIELTQGKVALVDDEDYDYLKQWLWSATKNGTDFYARRSIHVKGKPSIKVYMHRVIMKVSDPEILIDHKDRDGLNNQKTNLRPCTKKQNQVNRRSVKNTTSKYIGVSWNKNAKKWMAMTTKDYKPFYGGVYNNENDAALAYNRMALRLHGEFATINKIESNETNRNEGGGL